jgi:hypothetical protein
MPTFTVPAGQPGWMQILSRLLGPREAQAEVHPMDPAARRIWEDLQSGATIVPHATNPADDAGMPALLGTALGNPPGTYIAPGDPRAEVLAQIARRAQAQPAPVFVEAGAGVTMPRNQWGGFLPAGSLAPEQAHMIGINPRADFSPFVPAPADRTAPLHQPYARTLGHELVHYLMQATAPRRAQLGLTLPQIPLHQQTFGGFNTPEHEMINTQLGERKEGLYGMRGARDMPPADRLRQAAVAQYLLTGQVRPPGTPGNIEPAFPALGRPPYRLER